MVDAPAVSPWRSQQVAADLRVDILSGALPIGDRIAAEHELMARFSVSRQTIREALRELSTEGLIKSRRGPGGGAFVAAPDLDRIATLMQGVGTMMTASDAFSYDQICEAIFAIEAACCRLAAERRSAEDIEAMRRAIDGTTVALDEPQAFFDQHIAFNQALWAAAGNAPLQFVMHAFMQSLRASLSSGSRPLAIAEIQAFLRRSHLDIHEAIAAGNGELAVMRLRENADFWLRHPPTSGH